MSRKRERVLEAIFDEPVRANIDWRDVESLLLGLGAEITQGRGSRVPRSLERSEISLPSASSRERDQQRDGPSPTGVFHKRTGSCPKPTHISISYIYLYIFMKYKGYTGIVELDEESGTLFGRVIGLRDVITFQGESVAEIVQAFHDSVDDYLEFCVQRGESPEKPYSGQFVLRNRSITPSRDSQRGGSTRREFEFPGRECAQENFPHPRTRCDTKDAARN